MNKEIKLLNEKSEIYSEKIEKLREELKKIIVGQDEAVEKLMIALIAKGHVLVEGVPGLAKTLMIKTLSDAIDSKFVRLQFTPDLLPADIIGTKIYDHKNQSFSTIKGPIFTNFVLADEINRAPPKVQSALLEAMQEKQVSIQGETHLLKDPFLVLATQNPIESEGTYKLPEAQIDRFMFKILISYPDRDEEKTIIKRFTHGETLKIKPMISEKEIVEIQDFCQKIYADEKIEDYVTQIIDATRHTDRYKLNIDGYVEYGASPRATIWLILAAKAHALINKRGYVLPEDIKAIAYEVLRHRIILTYEAEADGITPDQIIKIILDKIKVP